MLRRNLFRGYATLLFKRADDRHDDVAIIILGPAALIWFLLKLGRVEACGVSLQERELPSNDKILDWRGSP